jgi:hypothetical protein
MPKKTKYMKEDTLRGVWNNAMLNFNKIQIALRDERKQCLEDRRFLNIAGAMYEGSLEKQFKKKPKFEVNKIQLAVTRINNEYRNNRISVDFVSKDGSENDKFADVLDGLFRADEQDSTATEAYDNCFEEGMTGGFGALRLTTAYEDEEDDENDRQRIRIEPINDADTSVWFDLDSKRQDKADAMYCYVIISMSPEKYTKLWDKSPTSVNKQISDVEFDWFQPDVVFVAEYYIIEETKVKVKIFKNIDGSRERFTHDELKEDPDLEDQLESMGSREISNKTITVKRVHKYILSGNEVLEDNGFIAGNKLPIVPSYGKRVFIDNIERIQGHVRPAKDMQRLKNMQISKLAEIAAVSPISKPIFSPEQMATPGIKEMWSKDNIENYPYLLVDSITDKEGNPQPAGALGYTKAPEIPQANAALLQITDTDIKELLGNYDEANKIVSGVSGKAVELVGSRIDGNAFIYMTNFAKCIHRVGEVWLSMAKDIYVEENRTMKTIGKSDNIASVDIMQPIIDDNGAKSFKNDLTKASFDVAVDVGPSSTSKRDALVKSLTNVLQMTTDPETSQVLQSMILMNMEGEGLSDAKEWSRKKLVGMGVLKPTEEEEAAMSGPQEPTAQDKALEAMANESDANAAKARASIVETLANAGLDKAKTEQVMADIESQIFNDNLKLLNQ